MNSLQMENDGGRHFDPDALRKYIGFIESEKKALRDTIASRLMDFERRTLLKIESVEVTRVELEYISGKNPEYRYGVDITVGY